MFQICKGKLGNRLRCKQRVRLATTSCDGEFAHAYGVSSAQSYADHVQFSLHPLPTPPPQLVKLAHFRLIRSQPLSMELSENQ